MDIMQMIQQFNQFRQIFTGNPQQEVQKLIQSGRITQQQLNQLQSFAKQFQSVLQSFSIGELMEASNDASILSCELLRSPKILQ